MTKDYTLVRASLLAADRWGKYRKRCLWWAALCFASPFIVSLFIPSQVAIGLLSGTILAISAHNLAKAMYYKGMAETFKAVHERNRE